MANIENKYFQVTLDSADAEPVTSVRWMKVGIAAFWGSCVALMLVGASSTSQATGPMTSAAESTNLMGMSTFLRPSGVSMKPGVMKSMNYASLPGSSPFKKIAVSAIEANILGNRMRDVSMSAESQVKLKDEISNLDDTSKEVVAEVKETVLQKAKKMAGVSGPLGYFDPVGFVTETTTEGKLLFYREVELKHGRVAMLASLGFLVGEQFHPLFGGNIDVPSYIAFQQTPLQAFWPAVVAAIAIPEIFSVQTFIEPNQDNDSLWAMDTEKNRVPGDFGFDPLGLKPRNADELKELQTKELNNGRLAMIAAAGMVAQELVTGQKIF